MEYHEIGDKFIHEGKLLEVVPYTYCSDCRFSFLNDRMCSIPCNRYCWDFERKDNKNIMYKLIEQDNMNNIEQTNTQSKKNDRLDDKLRWELLPLEDMEDIVKVYTAGAKKYGPNMWQNLPDGYQRYKAAMFRHLVEYEKGNWLDNETNCIHLAQVAWNAIAMLHIAKQNMKNNERTICSKKEDLLTEAKDTPEK